MCIVHPPRSTLSPYLEPGWLLQMARLRRSLLYPVLPPLSATKCAFTHVVRGSIVASPHAELPRLPRRIGVFQLKAAAQVSEERQPPKKQRCDVSNSFSLLLSLFHNPHGRQAAALGCHSRAARKGRTMSPTVRLTPGARSCLRPPRPGLKVVRVEVWKTGGFRSLEV